jgi:hypothetical protein
MIETGFSLTQLQNWMLGMLVHHVPVINEPVLVETIVNPSQRLSAVKHLEIYRHSYIARLRACMQNQFSALAYALGNELFESFADQYLNAYPSESYTLNTLGERFADFLEQTRPDADEQQKESWPDFMIGLAEFEYALSEIFDEKAGGNNSIPDNNTPDEQLSISPVLRLFHHQFPICKYYLDFTGEKKPDLPFPEESFCAVVRRDYKLGLFIIQGAQYYFLLSMQQGRLVEYAKNELVKTFDFDRSAVDTIWPEWRRNFIASGFLSA